ncbi:MAG: lytic transglycosylase domain-containing protein [Pseudomonadota bacterium]|nr:lytic transglycosylase domain-containing protein [Pseudomonadota bacterium]
MILKYFRCLLYLSAAFAAGGAFAAGKQDEGVITAFDAYRAGDAIKFARQAKRVDGNHVLAPWMDYWRLAMRLEDASIKDVHGFFSKHADTYVAELLRGDWLKLAGKRRNWQEFDREAALYPRDDLEIRCYASRSRMERGEDAALPEGWWLEPAEFPDGCARLAETLVKAGRISTTQIWRRVRVLFENGQITAAKTALGYLPKNEAPDERLLAEAARQPKRLIARLPKDLEPRPTREVVVLAGVRHARNDPLAAAEAFEGELGERLTESELQYLWGRVAVEGAREHLREALGWFERAGDAPLDDNQLAWKARAALRAGSWHALRDAIDHMSPAARGEPAWIYWYGRALAAQGEVTGSRAHYLRISGQTDFYGLLANEELGYVSMLPEAVHVPSETEIEAAKAEPGLARALELIRLGIRTEGVREWLFAIRRFDDKQLIAASELARRGEVYDRTIHTADRTARLHNFSLRYPLPYHQVFREYAQSHGLDEAWVLGLVRQESRFITEARSSAGAAGLMQVMPGTARYIASKMGLRNYRSKSVTEIKINVTLGTGYLKLVLDQLGHPVLASAAYNAGPSRARRWRDADRPLEGAVYAETIPFTETRDYVKKVMANSVFYAAVLEQKLVPLKARLGTISARSGAEPTDEDLLP